MKTVDKDVLIEMYKLEPDDGSCRIRTTRVYPDGKRETGYCSLRDGHEGTCLVKLWADPANYAEMRLLRRGSPT